MLQCAGFQPASPNLPQWDAMSLDRSQPLRVAMLARVVFPLHGFGGIERHVFHLVTHLDRLGVQVTLYVQPPTTDDRRPPTDDRRLKIEDRSVDASEKRSSILHPPSSLHEDSSIDVSEKRS